MRNHKAKANWICEAEHVHQTRNDRYACMQRLTYALKEALCNCGRIRNTFVIARHRPKCTYRLTMEKFCHLDAERQTQETR